jgi:hypothetical protein
MFSEAKTNGIKAGGYTINNSLRFRSSANANLTKVFSSTTYTYTLSMWVKRGKLGVEQILTCARSSGSGGTSYFEFNSSDQLNLYLNATSICTTTAVYRDPSAWYHIVLSVTQSGTAYIYVNGQQVASGSAGSSPFLFAVPGTGYVNAIGIYGQSTSAPFDGYMAEINYIDGTALTPSSFGAYSTTTGVWQPIKYSGTYGTNGFYLPFVNNTTSTYAGLFNGSSQRLSISSPSSSLINWYSSNFTLEYWINPTSFAVGANSESVVIGNMDPASSNDYWSFGPITGGTIKFYWYSGSANALTTTQTIPTGQWSHLAFVKNGTTLTIYINGLAAATTTLSNSPQSSNTYPLSIGATNSTFFNGSLSNLRIVNGTAVYTSNFTPPTGPLTAITNTALLTLQNATIVDNSTNAYTISNTGSTTTATANPFGLPDIAADASGNGNNWTTNNISLTAGSTYDAMIDSPTVGLAASNYCVLNPLNVSSQGINLWGNLSIIGQNSYVTAASTIPFTPNSGKWYWEAIAPQANNQVQVGVCVVQGPSFTGVPVPIANSNGICAEGNGYWYVDSSTATTGHTPTFNPNTTWLGCLWDSGTNTYSITVDGSTFTTVGSVSTTDGRIWAAAVSCYATNDQMAINFGQQPFKYSIPSGAKAINTYNLSTPTIVNGALYNAATLYTGTGSSQAIVNSQSNGGNNALGITFEPDLIWIKSRSAATNHKLTDTVRGVTKALVSNSTAAETTDTNGLTTFGSGGFTVGSDTNYNNSGATYVGWQWNAGSGTSGSNTNGSITSTVSVNATAGFSVVTYTGTGANATVGHGLGVAPSMVIVKSRSLGTENWDTFHTSLAAGNVVQLNTTIASTSAPTMFTTTLPTSSVFSVGTNTGTNGSGSTYVAYCWAAVAGYSAFGTYTGNGNTNGPFIYTGFRPRFVIIKSTTQTTGWNMYDTSRDTYNVSQTVLQANSSSNEFNGSNQYIDVNSNGFKIRNASGTLNNSSSDTYIYACFAENPFKYALAR